jgi:hypothetical protein
MKSWGSEPLMRTFTHGLLLVISNDASRAAWLAAGEAKGTPAIGPQASHADTHTTSA